MAVEPFDDRPQRCIRIPPLGSYHVSAVGATARYCPVARLEHETVIIYRVR